MDTIYDTHTICIKEQVNPDVLRKRVKELVGPSLKYRLSINIPRLKSKEKANFAYIWVDSEEVYWMLLGSLNASRAFITPDEDYYTDRLKLKIPPGDPSWPSRLDVKKKFEEYSTGRVSVKELKSGETRIMIITFSNPVEALFARLMLRKVRFRHKSHKSLELVTLLIWKGTDTKK